MSKEFEIGAKTIDRETVLKCADELEVAIGEVLNGQRKPGKLPIEPMARLIAYVRAFPTVAPADERIAGIELAAQWVQKRFDDWDTDHGCTDPETGVREYGNQAKEDYACELLEIIEGIRALKSTRALSGGER